MSGKGVGRTVHRPYNMVQNPMAPIDNRPQRSQIETGALTPSPRTCLGRKMIVLSGLTKRRTSP